MELCALVALKGVTWYTLQYKARVSATLVAGLFLLVALWYTLQYKARGSATHVAGLFLLVALWYTLQYKARVSATHVAGLFLLLRQFLFLCQRKSHVSGIYDQEKHYAN
jgi:hypothetical protein